jgi:hypothetical protein
VPPQPSSTVRATGRYFCAVAEARGITSTPASSPRRPRKRIWNTCPPAAARAWATLYSQGGDTDEPVRTVLGIVELDEGLWWWSQLVDVDPDADLEGLPVQVDFVPSGPDPEDEVVPVFRPAGPDQLS